MKKSTKLIIFVAAVCFLLLFLALYFLIFPVSLGIEGHASSPDAGLTVLPHRQPYSHSDLNGCTSPGADGSVYTLSKHGVLRCHRNGKTKIISVLVERMLPTDQGIVYSNIFGSLYYKEGDTKTLIAKGTHSFGWSGDDILYCKDGSLLSWSSGESNCIAEIPNRADSFEILANKNHIILICSGHLYLLDENGHLEELNCTWTFDDKLILFEDYLIEIGAPGQTGALVCHLPTGDMQSLNIGWYGSEAENTISVAYDGKYIYLSVYTKPWSQFDPENYPVKTATLRVNPDSWSAEKISPNFYDALVCIDGIIYGLELSPISGQWTPIS